MKGNTILLLGALTAALGFSAVPASADGLSGAGGTAIYPVLSKWAAQYDSANHVAVNYQAIGDRKSVV